MNARTHVHTLLRERVQQWVRIPLQANPTAVVQVIGGQIVGEVDCIQYEEDDPTLDQLYDPDVDTDYPPGMGRGWLMGANGRRLTRVLIRHDFSGTSSPLIGGWVYVVRGTTTLTVDSGDDEGRTMLAYTITWPI